MGSSSQIKLDTHAAAETDSAEPRPKALSHSLSQSPSLTPIATASSVGSQASVASSKEARSTSSKKSYTHQRTGSGINRLPGLKVLTHRLSFSKHSVPTDPAHSNLSTLLKKQHRTAPAQPVAQPVAEPVATPLQQPSPQPSPEVDGSSGSVQYSEEVESGSSDEDDDLKREEDIKDYCEGGYHPTFVGECYGTEKQYLIVRKLGWGHFSTVWLAFDSKHSRHVAIKIVRSSKNYREAAIDEIKILEKVQSGPDSHPGKKHIVEMLDHFVHVGPNGEHICMIFEVLGENMLSLLLRYKQFQKDKTNELKKTSTSEELGDAASVEHHISTINDLTILKESYGGLPLTLVKQIAKQLLLALDFLHRECGLIHTDIKPENVLVEINDVEKLLHLLEKDRKNKKVAKLMSMREQHNSTSEPTAATKLDRSRSFSHRSTPIRHSKPLTSPIETKGSVDNFFRSFSFSQKRTGSHESSNLRPFSASMKGSLADSPIPNVLSPWPAATFHVGAPFSQSAPSVPSAPSPSPRQSIASATTGIRTVSPRLSIKETPAETIPEEEGESSSEENEEEFVDAHEAPVEVPFPQPLPSSHNTPELSTPAARRISSFALNGTDSANTSGTSGGAGLHASLSHELMSRRESMLSTLSHQSSSTTTAAAAEFDSVISVKIADLGNACWTNLHYTNDIQTRQYRAPEIILGGKWGCSTDLWSVACLIFELITGDYLFDPKSGSTYNKNDDHLAQIIELLQIWPTKDYLKKCKYSREFFDKSYQSLKSISKLKIWTLSAVLSEKYHIDDDMASEISRFLLAMLEFEPKRRVDAGSMSNHSWLADCLVDEHVDREFGLRGQDIKGYCSELKSE